MNLGKYSSMISPGEVAGRSPVDRGKQGMKRSVACDGGGIPLHLVAARANEHDSPLLEPTLAGIPDMLGPHLEQAQGSQRPIVAGADDERGEDSVVVQEHDRLVAGIDIGLALGKFIGPGCAPGLRRYWRET
jgi:hypothetical protein